MIELDDGVRGLLSLQSGSVALVLSDLPSGETRADFDVAPDLDALWPALWHALRCDGVAVLMASSLRFAARLMASQQQHFRHDLIWSKSLATGHLNAARAPLRAHEFILVFSRSVGTYHPQMLQGASPIHAARRAHNGENYGRSVATDSRAGATDRYPTSVLEFASVGTSSKARKHPQQKPEPLLRCTPMRASLSWTLTLAAVALVPPLLPRVELFAAGIPRRALVAPLGANRISMGYTK